jgi:hypothetical protein
MKVVKNKEFKAAKGGASLTLGGMGTASIP